MDEIYLLFFVGFCAQLVDASLGMAYGVTSTTLLLSLGLPPVTASAVTHAAECVTTGFSAIAHHQLGNVDKALFKSLLFPGMVGSILGALFLLYVDGEIIKPFVSLYLLILGIIIILKAFQKYPPKLISKHLTSLGLAGGFMDATGGGGWGSIVTTTLMMRGNEARFAIGSVNACEFFITLTTTATFLIGGTVIGWKMVAALALGGAIASPFGAWLCKHMPPKLLMFIVGVLIIFLSLRVFWISF